VELKKYEFHLLSVYYCGEDLQKYLGKVGISKAVELCKKIVVVKISSTNKLPSEIVGVGASMATHFSFELIKTALDNAT